VWGRLRSLASWSRKKEKKGKQGNEIDWFGSPLANFRQEGEPRESTSDPWISLLERRRGEKLLRENHPNGVWPSRYYLILLGSLKRGSQKRRLKSCV